MINDAGRVCGKCKIFKEWADYLYNPPYKGAYKRRESFRENMPHG